MFQATVACFNSRNHNQGGHYKSFGAKNGGILKSNVNQAKQNLKQFLQPTSQSNQNVLSYCGNYSKNSLKKNVSNRPFCQVCDRVNHHVRANVTQLNDTYSGSDGIMLDNGTKTHY